MRKVKQGTPESKVSSQSVPFWAELWDAVQSALNAAHGFGH